MSSSVRSLLAIAVGSGVAIAGALIACSSPELTPVGGSKDSDAGASNGSVTVESACHAWAEAEVDIYMRCVPSRYGQIDRAWFIGREEAACTLRLTAPGTGATAPTTAGCADQYKTMSCDDLDATGAPEACRQITGSFVNGKACVASEQCQSGFCLVPAGGACGVCTKLPGEGEDCPDARCSGLLACVGGKCITRGGTGTPCTDDYGCNYGFHCGDDKKCAPPLALGAPCTVVDGQFTRCNFGADHYCNTQTNTCTAPATATKDQKCSTGSENKVVCADGTNCTTVDGGQACTPYFADDGAHCGEDSLPCRPPATCVSTLCTLPSVSSCQ